MNVRTLLRTPPGFRTTIGTVLPTTRSVAGMAAFTRELETKVVGRSTPSQVTTAPLTNSEPFTTRTNAGSPAGTLAGTRDDSVWP